MLKRDYLSQEIDEFIKVVRRAVTGMEEGEPLRDTAVLEEATGELFDLDAPMLLSLAPESMVTMVELSGDSETKASYAAESLLVLADCYGQAGDAPLAELRRAQSAALCEAYGLDPANPAGAGPEE